MGQSSGMPGGGGQPRPGGQAGQRPQQPKVNNIKIQIPETTFQAMLARGQQQGQPGPGQAGGSPPGAQRPQMDPRVLQALMQRAQMGQAG